MSTVHHSRESLQSSWRILHQQCRSACDLWNDPVRHRFEREFWLEYEQVVPATVDEMERLAQIIAQARRHVH